MTKSLEKVKIYRVDHLVEVLNEYMKDGELNITEERLTEIIKNCRHQGHRHLSTVAVWDKGMEELYLIDTESK